MNKFPCDKCGLCCLKVGASDIYRHLDRGDGACIHYDEKSKLCTIYDTRPEICRVDEMYDKYYKNQYSKGDFHLLNLAACSKLKENYGK